ncbi:hypothetical protein ACVINX_006509 [Bradyrhizobium diazoefficiens]
MLVAAWSVGKERCLPRRIVREAAAGEHDTAAGANLKRRAVMNDARARDAGSFAQERSGRRRRHDANAKRVGGFQQPGHKRVAVDEMHAAAEAQHVDQMPREPARDMPEGGQRGTGVEKVPEIRARRDGHPERGDFIQRRLEIAEAWTELTAIDRRRAERAAARDRARALAVKIRDLVAVDESKMGLALEELDHARALLEEHVDAGCVVTIGELMPQIEPGLLGGLDDAGRFRQRIARDPHPAAGPRCGAAKLSLLLDHDDVETERGARNRSSQAACARADHEQIAIEMFVASHVSLRFTRRDAPGSPQAHVAPRDRQT